MKSTRDSKERKIYKEESDTLRCKNPAPFYTKHWWSLKCGRTKAVSGISTHYISQPLSSLCGVSPVERAVKEPVSY